MVKKAITSQKTIIFLITVFLTIMLIPTIASANGPAPAASFDIYVKNAPEGSYGLDFLLPKDSLDKDGYFSDNRALLNNMGLSLDCELAKIDSDGYVSYLAHYSNAKFCGYLEASPSADGTLTIQEFAHRQYDGGFDYIAYSLPDLKLVIFNDEGAILTVSDCFQIAERPIDIFKGALNYDAETGIVTPSRYTSAFAAIFLLIQILLICGLTIGIEVLVGLCFKLKPLSKVALVTGLSNLAMNILLFICCICISHPLPYLPCVIAGEILAIAIEFLLYIRIYKETKRARLFAFSLSANLISAMVIFVLSNGMV